MNEADRLKTEERLLVRCVARAEVDPVAVLWVLDRPGAARFLPLEWCRS
jgi:hypothetical protein